MSNPNPLDTIASKVPDLDLWQPRDWPHRRGDELKLSLHSVPLSDDSPGRRSHACEHCGGPALVIHDNILCWKCKGTFSMRCTADPNAIVAMSVEKMLKDGFAKCHVCQEPLRSIGLLHVFREMLEAKTSQDSLLPPMDGLGGMVMLGISKKQSTPVRRRHLLKWKFASAGGRRRIGRSIGKPKK